MSDLSSGVRAVMPDVQGRHDVRAMPIARVGVKNLRYPLVLEVAGGLTV